MTNIEFVEKLKLAAGVTTLYVMGGIGMPAGVGNSRTRVKKNYEYNREATRAKMIDTATADTFFFDCVCLGKSILWGWDADVNRTYGGAQYMANGVPDFFSGKVPSLCSDNSTDFSQPDKIAIGEWLYLSGSNHIGYYVGDGNVIECTPAWKNGVQYTKLTARNWTSHGKIQYIEYVEPETIPEIVCPVCGTHFIRG